jgi:hypothetical protein
MGSERKYFFFALSALGPIHLLKKMMDDAQTRNLRLIIIQAFAGV